MNSINVVPAVTTGAANASVRTAGTMHMVAAAAAVVMAGRYGALF
jgi:hypothetical protein